MGRQPRLLDKNLKEVARLRPSALSAISNLSPISTATMEVPEGEPAVGVHDFVEVFGPDGSLGVFRVASSRTSYRKSQQLSLEHALCTLEDDLTPGSTRNEKNDVVEFKIEGTLSKVVNAILSYQSTARWIPGNIDDTGASLSLTVDRETLLDALISTLDLVEGYGIFPDTSVTPWRVNVKKLEATPSSECRMMRNAPGVTIAYEDSDLVTRAYHPALPGGYLDADTISTWGVIAQEIPVQDDAVPEEVLEYAQKFLADRKNPRVSVEIDGLYLSQITGEPLDAFKPGHLCRVALPDYGVSVNERIVSVHFSDLVNAPEQVTISLSTSPRTLSRDLASIKKEAESAGSTARRNSGYIGGIKNDLEEKNTLIQELKNDIILRAKVEDLEATNKRVSTAEINIKGLEAEIQLKASVETVDAAIKRIKQAEIDINGDEATIGLKAQVEEDRKKINSAEIAIDGINATLDLKVEKNGVISAINLSPEQVKINSNKIILDGQTIVGYLEGSTLSINELDADVVYVGENIQIRGDVVSCPSLYAENDIQLGEHIAGWQSKTVVTGYTVSGGQQQFVTIKDTSGKLVNVLRYGAFNKSTIYYIGRV